MDAGTLSESASSNLTELTADIVAAYISHNSVRAEDLAGLINTVHAALGGVSNGSATPAEAEKRQPAVPVKKSITPDFLVSLFDGKKYKSLKRHLRTSYNMTPEQYREYFNLPRDYPMVAPNYAKARSDLAKSMGLGQQRKKTAGKNAGRRGAKKAA
jgi:predicted transcriptional regulator